MPVKILFFNADEGRAHPLPVSIEGRGPCSHRVKLILSRLQTHVLLSEHAPRHVPVGPIPPLALAWRPHPLRRTPGGGEVARAAGAQSAILLHIGVILDPVLVPCFS